MVAGARYGAHSGNHDPVVLDEKEKKKIMDSTPTIGIVSALLVTVTFAASFTVPGGYRADDDPESSHHTAGTPVLAATYSFQAFIVANNMALLCSSMATISLMYAGITTVDIGTRMRAFVLSIFFLNSSARSLAAAFAFGMYAALAPVAHAAAVVTWLCTAASLLDVAWFVCALLISQLALLNRIPACVCMLRFAAAFVCPLLGALWPYAIIAGWHMAGACQLTMESENKTQGSQSARNEAKLPVQLHRELRMAAQEGNPARLTQLLGNGAQATQPVPGDPGVIVNIGDAEATMDKSARPADTVGMDVAMDLELNKILHVVASSGDSPDFLESVRVVYGKASHLLDECNPKGDTPFHFAARAGMVKMLSQLIGLARAEGGGGDRVKEVLRKPIKQGETALREALRFADTVRVEAMVSRLMAADAELARVPPADGTSPLYLAVLLGYDDIAERLHQQDKGLSYSGPNGQNALHAAVLGSTNALYGFCFHGR
ncbi:hypothetical protein ACQ4PT_012840 [Festuca glaucescens]